MFRIMKMIKKAAVPLLFCLLVSSLLFGCGQKEEEQQAEPGTVEEAAGEETPEGSDDENGGFVIDLKDGSISSTEEETVETTEETTTAPDYSTMITGTMYSMDFINIRAEAGTDSEVIGHLNPEESIAVVEKVNSEWMQVVYEDRLCYVASEYLTEDPDWRAKIVSNRGYQNGDTVGLNPAWRFADYSAINSGAAVMYLADRNRKNITVGVNAGHGTKGGSSVKTYCHPDKTAKVTGGSTAAGAVTAMAVSDGMNFHDGTPEKKVTLQMAQILKELLLENGYDVLMIRDGEDVQLDNIARTVICNNAADCHIAIHWDGDSLDYDKGCFYMSVPDGIKYLDNVAAVWQEDERLGECLIKGLSERGLKIFSNGSMDMDLTQTSYSSVPSVDIELGNGSSDHSTERLYEQGYGLLSGINSFFGFE